MQELTNGQNLLLDENAFNLLVECELPSDNNAIDVSAFLLNQDNKTRNDDDFIFYNQPEALDKSICLSSTVSTNQSFAINLTKIQDDIHKIAFVITTPTAFKSALSLTVSITGTIKFSPNLQDMNETSLILAEIYRHKGQWKFRAIGQGYAGGLAPIAISYGVEIDDEPSENSDLADQKDISHTEQSSVENKSSLIIEQVSKPFEEKAPEIEGSVNSEPKEVVPMASQKVDLAKIGEKATISLVKGKKLTAKLQWDTKADLDLYCLYVDKNDQESKVYYRNLGSLIEEPFIQLLGDSTVAGEEIIEISKPEHLKYALICAYSAVSNGTGSFHSYKARVQVTDNDTQTVTSHLDHDDPRSYWVALAMIDFQEAGKVTIKNVETYANSKTFASQFKERTGEEPSKLFKKSKGTVNGISKYHAERSPHLFQDGSFMMSAGEIEFK